MSGLAGVIAGKANGIVDVEVSRLHCELSNLKNHLHLLEDAIRAAAAGDTTPAERIMAAQALGARLLTSRSVLGSIEGTVTAGLHCEAHLVRDGLLLLRRVVLTCPEPERVVVDIDLDHILRIAAQVSGKDLHAWGPLALEQILEPRRQLSFGLRSTVTQPFTITLFGEEHSTDPPPWM